MGVREADLESRGPGFARLECVHTWMPRSQGSSHTWAACAHHPSPAGSQGAGLTEDLPGSWEGSENWDGGVSLAARANEDTLNVKSEVHGKPLPSQCLPCESTLVAETLPSALNLGLKHCISRVLCSA